MTARRVSIFGFGTIGRYVATALAGGVDGLSFAGVMTRRPGENITLSEPRASLRSLSIEEALEASDIIVDCASPSVFEIIARPAVAAGKVFVTVNSGALAERETLFDDAVAHGATIIVPTGALLGIDAVRAAREGGIHSVTLTTRKPPASFAGVPYVASLDLGDLMQSATPVLIFRGSAREAAKALPQNINVAASLSFAGIGLDRTVVEVWSDPACTRNEHVVTVEAVDTSFSMRIQNHPSRDNPKTSMLAAASVVAALRQLVSPVRIGS